MNKSVYQAAAGEAERRPRFLVFAYACEPGRGSEPEAGWIWSRMLARLGEVWVITRQNNRGAIERGLPSIPEGDSLRFIYVDLPRWARFWKRRDKGARLYYVFWQLAALRAAKRLWRRHRFDAAWHLTWANGWIGSLAALLPCPFVYGPVGGGVSMDWRLASALGLRGILQEGGRSVVRATARYVNPLARLSWRRARIILVQNPETLAWFPRRHQEKVIVFPNVVLDREATPPRRVRRPRRRTLLYAGRLAPLKGLTLALRALVFLPEWRFVICGHGPDEKRLRALARQLEVADRVEFSGWLHRPEVFALMRQADVFVFPSLHDEGGFVVAEAIAEGLPVVCLARGGPRVIGGSAIEPGTRSDTVARLGAAIGEAAGRPSGAFPRMSACTGKLRAVLGEAFPHWDLNWGEFDPSPQRDLEETETAR